jgi:hypothetical protein
VNLKQSPQLMRGLLDGRLMARTRARARSHVILALERSLNRSTSPQPLARCWSVRPS